MLLPCQFFLGAEVRQISSCCRIELAIVPEIMWGTSKIYQVLPKPNSTLKVHDKQGQVRLFPEFTSRVIDLGTNSCHFILNGGKQRIYIYNHTYVHYIHVYLYCTSITIYVFKYVYIHIYMICQFQVQGNYLFGYYPTCGKVDIYKDSSSDRLLKFVGQYLALCGL